MMDLTDPVLAIERIETSADLVSAEVRIGERHDQVRLGMSRPELIEYVHIPDTLSSAPEVLRAVVDLLRRAHEGEAVSTPLDLSAVVRQANEEWPISVREYANVDQNAALSTAIVVTQTIRGETGLTTLSLRVHDVPSVVLVDRRGQQDGVVRFRFASGVHPWQLSAGESYSMLRALMKATAPQAVGEFR
jgi:hypothetical protein